MNRVAADHRDNPLSTCQYTSKDLHASDPMAPKVSSRHPLVSRSFGTMPTGKRMKAATIKDPPPVEEHPARCRQVPTEWPSLLCIPDRFAPPAPSGPPRYPGCASPSRESDLEARTEVSLYASAKLGATELALVRDEDVDFDARFEMDDVCHQTRKTGS